MKASVILFLILVSTISFAETTCTKNGCDILITLKIAFQGADDAYINRAVNEIQNTWNGPNGYRTTGDCKCKMTFQVLTAKAQDCKNNPPAGYHCIMVTNFNNNPPRNQTNITGAKYYIGYMYGVSAGNGGNSEKGWWSDIMSRPVNANQPQGEHYKDFAHEAGHMMGLEDGDGGIMSRTSGANSGPTQANIDEIADDICGADACPDRCCCGNGQIDTGKGEQCDPKASPKGCPSGQECCAVCCGCYGLMCVRADNEYSSQSSCQAACGADSKCYKNYKTGCWNCVKQDVVVHETCHDSQNIRGNTECDHVEKSFVNRGVDFYEKDLSILPVLGDVFANERVNLVTEEGDNGHIITQEKDVTGYGDALLSDHTVTVSTDRETMGLIASDEMDIQQAISTGRINIDGNGIDNGMRFWFYHLFFDVFTFFNPAEEFVPAEEGDSYPQEYYNEMAAVFESEEVVDPNPDAIGELPDGGIFGEVYPE
jgi:hypothetical protein